jgi:hypothetical protein
MALTAAVVARCAATALPASLEHLHSNTVPDLDPPTPGRGLPNLLDDADRFVTGDKGLAAPEGPRVLLVIRSAQPACLDADQTVVVTDFRERELSEGKMPRCLQHQRAD